MMMTRRGTSESSNGAIFVERPAHAPLFVNLEQYLYSNLPAHRLSLRLRSASSNMEQHFKLYY